MDWHAAVRRRAAAAALDLPRATIEELAEHLEDAYAAARREGLSDDAARARAAALLETADWTALRGARDPRRLRARQTDDLARVAARPGALTMMTSLRMAVRQFRLHPAFALTTIVVLGLGIGAAAAVYSIVDAVILRPLPYERPDRLVAIWDTNVERGLSHDPISPVNFMDQRALPVFEDAAAWWRPGVNLNDPGLEPLRVSTIETSANLFRVLGVEPQLGAGFPVEDELYSREPIAAISDRLWRTRYGGDPSIVGRQIRMNGVGVVITGVMPPGFTFPDDVDVWQRMNWDMRQHSRSAHFMEAVARLRDGATIAQAQAAVDALWPRLEDEFGATRNSPGTGWGSRLIPLLNDQLGYYRPALFVLFGAVGLLLAIGMLNVASLLLTRLLSRERELAIRTALGASTGQLVIQLLAESLVLSVGGAIAGLAAAAALLPLAVAAVPVAIPRLAGVGVGWPAIGFGVALALATTVVFGVAPAALVLRGQVQPDLKSAERGTSRGARRVYAVLVAVEVALAGALVAGSALLVRTVRQMTETPLGVQADDTTVAQIQMTTSSASNAMTIDQWREIDRRHADLLAAVRRQPGVEAAGSSNVLPLDVSWRLGVSVDGQPVSSVEGEALPMQMHSVSPGYFEAMGVTLAAGRGFEDFDTADGAAVAIVNQTFARRYFGDATPLGRTVRINSMAIGPLGRNVMPGYATPGGMPWTVVGVVNDVRNVPLGQDTEPAVYLCARQFPFAERFIAVKARTPADGAAAIRTALAAVAPEQPMGEARTWGARVADRTAEQRLLMAVLVGFGAIAALLAAVGVYGLFSWSVALRRRELAIRMALGASPALVGGRVVAHSVMLVAAGLAGGLLIVRVSERLLATVLYGVTPGDPRSLASAGAILLAAAIAACVPAAIRAMRVDPVDGLRTE